MNRTICKMKTLVALFLVFLPVIYTWDCTYFGIDNSACLRFADQGCSWSGSTCTGTFAYASCTGCKYVDPEGPPGSTGSSAADPYLTLDAALAASSSASTIYLWNNYPSKVFRLTTVFKTLASVTIKYCWNS